MKPQDSGTEELFRSKLKNIINLRHELVRLGELIDWARLEAHFAPYYKEAGRPAQDGTGSCFIGANGETAGERARPCLAHRASEAR
jgi:hypothetical protein